MLLQQGKRLLTSPWAPAQGAWYPGTACAPPRDVTVCGRRDGYSKARKSNRRPERKVLDSGPTEMGAWWEDGDQPVASVPAPPQPRGLERPQERSRDNMRRQSEKQEVDERGWWQNPSERSLQAYLPEELQSWQIEGLERAVSMGRRKVKVLELAQQLDLDRSQVLHWMKEFALRPSEETAPILAQRRAEVAAAAKEEQQQQQQQQEQQEQEHLAVNGQTGELGASDVQPHSQSDSPVKDPVGWQRWAENGAGLVHALGEGVGSRGVEGGRSSNVSSEALRQQQQQGGPQGGGFIPFYTRKEMGMVDPKYKRLSADAIRTLESIYNRTPFPSKEVIRGLWDLHRLNKDMAIDWFASRRESDGVMSSEQKRREPGSKDRDGFPSTNLTSLGIREAMGPVAYDENNLLVQLARKGGADVSGSGPGAAEGRGGRGGGQGGEQQQGGGQQQQQQQQLVSITKRQLAMLQSSLPSPHKYKGKMRNETMGISAPDAGTLQVGTVKYVAKPDDPEAGARRWNSGWRSRRASAPSKLLPILMEPREPAT